MTKQAIVGFIRGLVYAAILGVTHYIETKLGSSGLVSDTVALVILGICAAIDHVIPTP